jgi:S1-C subfamily serine protease
MADDGSYGFQPFMRRRRGNMFTHMLTGILAAAAAIGLLLAFVNPAAGGPGALPGGNAVPSPPPTSAPLASDEQAIVTKVRPGVVIISTTLQYNSEIAAGTGMVINADGLVLTNNHVIEDSTSITATIAATGQAYKATVIGYDKTGDVALIQLQNAKGLATVPVGDSATVKAGDTVVALGNAAGQNVIRTAPGQVTGLNETITASDQAGATSSETLHGMIQTNADIVAGDSGGPLSSANGVIGMDTAGSDSGSQQMAVGYAIPINTALSVARQIADGKASPTVSIGYPPFLGIFTGSSSDPSPQAQAQEQQQQSGSGSSLVPACYSSNAGLTVPAAIAPVSSGTLVVGTICGSPAAQAGLAGGAVITAINGKAVGAPGDLTTALAPFHPKDTISVTWVTPGGEQQTSRIELAAGPPQ